MRKNLSIVTIRWPGGRTQFQLFSLIGLLGSRVKEGNMFANVVLCLAAPFSLFLLPSNKPFVLGLEPTSFLPKQNLDLDLRKNLQNYTLRVGVFEGEDYEYDCWGKTRNQTFFIEESYSQHILELLQQTLNFKVEFIPSSSWGFFERTSRSWTGLASLVARGEVDLAACHWTATGRLPAVADFLLSTLESTESFVYLPQNLPLNRDVFVEMFSKKLWPFFLLSILLMVVSLRFSTSMHSRVRPDHEPWTWTEVVLWAVAAVSQQSYSRHPRGSSCRTMFLIGYSITYLLYTGFAAGVTSLLALQGHRDQLYFDDVAHLDLNLLLNRDEFYSDFLEIFSKTDKDYSKLSSTTQYSNLKEIFAKIQQKNFVGLGSTATLTNYLKKKKGIEMRENVAVVPIPWSVHQKSFLVGKKFEYKKLFNYWILRLKETGVTETGKRRHLPGARSPGPRSPQWLSADLNNVFSAFIFLAGGWLASLLLLFGEILWMTLFAPRKN